MPSFFTSTTWTNEQISKVVPTAGLGAAICDIYKDGCPIYVTKPGDPTYTVKVTKDWGPGFGKTLVPIPKGAVGSAGSDAWINIVDPVKMVNYSMWRFRPPTAGATTVTCAYGTIEDLSGSPTASTISGGTGGGAGISNLALVVLMSELEAGVIPHPLKFGCPITSPEFIDPAVKSDGTTAGGVPEGTLIRLDPTINLTTIPGITPFEKMVGTALQNYGAYCVDTAAAFAIYFECPTFQSPKDWYKANKVTDYQALPNLPWGSLSVVV